MGTLFSRPVSVHLLILICASLLCHPPIKFFSYYSSSANPLVSKCGFLKPGKSQVDFFQIQKDFFFFLSYPILLPGSTVAQWLSQPSHSKRVLGLFFVEFACSLHNCTTEFLLGVLIWSM